MKLRYPGLVMTAALLQAVVYSANAQWSTSGNNVYVTDTTKNVGIGTSVPDYRLQVFDNSRNYYVNRKITGQTENASGYNYILLHELYTGTDLGEHYVIGTISGIRGGTDENNRKYTVEVTTSSARNRNLGTITSYNEESRLVTLTYSSVSYLALEILPSGPLKKFSFTGYAQNDSLRILYDQDVSNVAPFLSMGTTAIQGPLKVAGVPVDPSTHIDAEVLFALQPYIESENIPLMTDDGTFATLAFEKFMENSLPFSKAASFSGAVTLLSDYIPVYPGEELYGEVWVMRKSGSSGSTGDFYCGIRQYDKDKMLVSNPGYRYFVASGITIPQNDTWTKYSGTTSLPFGHTPYNGSDGGATRYVRFAIRVNFSSGTIPTYFAGLMFRRMAPQRDIGPVVHYGQVGVGTNSLTSNAALNVNGPIVSSSFPYTLAVRDNRSMAQDVGGGIGFEGNDGSVLNRTFAVIQAIKENGTSSNYAGGMRFMTRVNGVSSVAEAWRITSAGILQSPGAQTIRTSTGTLTLSTAAGNGNIVLSPHGTGNIGIGTTSPSEKLSVNGNIIAKKLKVTQTGWWPDYVFDAEYHLPTLMQTEAFVKANRHLPGMPAAAEVEKNGLDVGEMNKLLLQKIEELTLYIIEQDKRIKALEQEAGRKK